MTQHVINQIINRALGDEAFRKHLKDDPQAALARMDLSQKEINQLYITLSKQDKKAKSFAEKSRPHSRLPTDILSDLIEEAMADATPAHHYNQPYYSWDKKTDESLLKDVGIDQQMDQWFAQWGTHHEEHEKNNEDMQVEDQ